MSLHKLKNVVTSLTIAVGVQDRPAAAPQTRPWESDRRWFSNPTFTEAAAAVSTTVFVCAGTPAFFPIVSEMLEPKDYPKSLAICQGTVTLTYTVISAVVYYFCGSYVSSPALGSAGIVMKLVCFGLALPGIPVSGTIMLHVISHRPCRALLTNSTRLPAKYVLFRSLQGTAHLTNNSVIQWAIWLGSTTASAVIAYIIASTLPEFGSLVSLIGALFGTSMCFQSMGAMWLYDDWCKPRITKWTCGVAWAVFVIVAGTFLTTAGTYGSVVEITNSYKASGGATAFRCAESSNSASGPH